MPRTWVYRRPWDRRALLRERHIRVLPGTGFVAPSVTIPIVAVPRLVAPRVHLHDGNGRELAQLTQVQGVSRSFVLNDSAQAQFQIAETDPQFSNIAPVEGRIITIRSVNYPLIWAGEIVNVDVAQDTYWATVTARSLESLLDWSTIEVDREVYGEASQIVRDLVNRANAESPTGITLGGLEAGGIVGTQDDPLNLGGRRLRAAIDLIVAAAGMEWWLDYSLEGSQLVTKLHMARRRGVARYGSMLMAGPGGNIADRPAWSETSDAGIHSMRVIAGAASATTEFASRASARFQRSEVGRVPGAEVASLEDVHGYPPDETFDGLNPVTRKQAVRVVELIRGQQGARALAETLLTSRRAVSRSVTVQVVPNQRGEAFWADYLPGNIVRLAIGSPVLRTGYDGPVRILGVQPMEGARSDGGFCSIKLEIRGRRRDVTSR